MIGDIFSHYRVLEKIGSGGMGDVYRATDIRLGRSVALKFVPEKLAGSPQAITRFRREAKAASALNHPHICTIYDIGEQQGKAFIVMELLEGQTLRERLQVGPLQLRDWFDIAVQICDGLQAAHARGIIHRDIKPANIFLTHHHGAKILDFGIAKVLGQGTPDRPAKEPITLSREDSSGGLTCLTRGDTLIGTIAYMSPEQARGENIDTRTDLFSFGSVLYEMATGRPAFSRNTSAETFEALLNQTVIPPSHFNEQFNAGFDSVILRAMARSLHQRYPNAASIVGDLRRLERNSYLARQPSDAWSIQRGNRQAAAGALPGVSLEARQPSDAWSIQRGNRQAIARALPGVSLEDETKTATVIPAALKPADLTNSIAVLPFENAGADAGMEYMSDGIAEALINRLTRFRRLRVVPRSTTFRYRDCGDPLQTGRDLHVRLVLVGRVLQAGESLSLQIELVDTTLHSQVWGEHFKRKVSDLFDLQEEIVSEIAKRLQLQEEDGERLRQRPPSRDAFHLLVRGNYYANKWSPEGISKGLEYARQSIEADPAYAEAHSLLAYVYSMLGYFGVLPPKEAFPRAKAAAIRALELDDTIAAGHFSLGIVHFLYEWDWSAAETEIKRGLSLAPNDAAGQFLYGEWLLVMNRLDEALARIELAFDLNPLSSPISANLASAYYLTGQTDRALEQMRKTIELDPSFVPGPAFLAVLLARLGRYEEAIAKALACQSMPGSDLRGRSTLALVYAMAGRRAEALEIAASLEAEPQLRKLNANLPHIYGVLGLREKVLAALEQQYEERVSSLLFARRAPELTSLHDDPKFAELLCRIGLPQLPLSDLPKPLHFSTGIRVIISLT